MVEIIRTYCWLLGNTLCASRFHVRFVPIIQIWKISFLTGLPLDIQELRREN